MNMKNDVAFLVDFQLNLYEHQSTWNPNMPLRNLFYAAREYQTLTRDQSLYAPQLVKIPTPNFVVFYNGDKEIGDSCVLKISEMCIRDSSRHRPKVFASPPRDWAMSFSRLAA